MNAFTVKTRASHAGQPWSQAAPLLSSQGWMPVPGAVVALPKAFVPASETSSVAAAWQLPTVRDQECFVTTAQLDASLIAPLRAPALTLAVWDRKDRRAKETVVCDGFDGVGPADTLPKPWLRPVGSFTTVEGGQALRASDTDADGRAELAANGGIAVSFAQPVARVTVELAQWGGVVMLRGYNSGNQLVAQRDATPGDGVVQTLSLDGTAIMRVTMIVKAGIRGARFALRRLCTVQRDPLPPIGQPQVSGRREGQLNHLAWLAKPVGSVLAPDGGMLTLIRYQPTDLTVAWRELRVAAFADAHLLLVGVSGVDAALADLIAANEAAKDEIKKVVGPADAGDPPKVEKTALLKPGREYRIVVETEWAIWEKSDSQLSPPASLPANAWQSFGVSEYRFTVAKEDASEAALQQPVALLNEAAFDPRALSRYLLGLTPNGGAPHFLDDPLAAHFEIEYADALCAMYDRGLTLKLRRTDPPSGSLAVGGAEFQSAADLPLVIQSGPLGYPQIDTHDHWWIDAEIAPPCIPLDGPKGETKTMMSPAIAPDAEYDLLLVAPPLATPQADQVLVARSHFRTSRYTGPAALLEALGLAVTPPNQPQRVQPMRPEDLFLDAAVALPLPFTGGDQALEAALRTLGLDPLPLPEAPRLAAIWQPSGANAHALWGVIVDAAEPLERADRLRHKACVLKRTGQPDVPLKLFRHNASTTRLLYRADAPPTWSGAGTLELTLDSLAWVGQALVASPVTGRRALHGTPRSLAEGAP